jgi:predicted flap endonuclease-1-like 5' DNA nuclease
MGFLKKLFKIFSAPTVRPPTRPATPAYSQRDTALGEVESGIVRLSEGCEGRNTIGWSELAEQTADIFEGVRFKATMQIRTPLSVLKHHGELFEGSVEDAPSYGSNQNGSWSYSVKPSLRIPGFGDIIASDIGPISATDYLPFLMDFRTIVEGEQTVDEKIKQIKALRGEFPLFMKKLMSSGNDFPASFFYNEFCQIPGIGNKTARLLFAAGIKTCSDLSKASDKEILSIHGIGETSLKKIREHTSRSGSGFF